MAESAEETAEAPPEVEEKNRRRLREPMWCHQMLPLRRNRRPRKQVRKWNALCVVRR